MVILGLNVILILLTQVQFNWLGYAPALHNGVQKLSVEVSGNISRISIRILVRNAAVADCGILMESFKNFDQNTGGKL